MKHFTGKVIVSKSNDNGWLKFSVDFLFATESIVHCLQDISRYESRFTQVSHHKLVCLLRISRLNLPLYISATLRYLYVEYTIKITKHALSKNRSLININNVNNNNWTTSRKTTRTLFFMNTGMIQLSPHGWKSRARNENLKS